MFWQVRHFGMRAYVARCQLGAVEGRDVADIPYHLAAAVYHSCVATCACHDCITWPIFWLKERLVHAVVLNIKNAHFQMSSIHFVLLVQSNNSTIVSMSLRASTTRWRDDIFEAAPVCIYILKISRIVFCWPVLSIVMCSSRLNSDALENHDRVDIRVQDHWPHLLPLIGHLQCQLWQWPRICRGSATNRLMRTTPKPIRNSNSSHLKSWSCRICVVRRTL